MYIFYVYTACDSFQVVWNVLIFTLYVLHDSWTHFIYYCSKILFYVNLTQKTKKNDYHFSMYSNKVWNFWGNRFKSFSNCNIFLLSANIFLISIVYIIIWKTTCSTLKYVQTTNRVFTSMNEFILTWLWYW